jgi:hypothetical protein
MKNNIKKPEVESRKLSLKKETLQHLRCARTSRVAWCMPP